MTTCILLQEKKKRISTNELVKSNNSGTTWSFIVKRSLKIPKTSVKIERTITNKTSEDSSNEVQFIKIIKTQFDGEATRKPPVVYPHQVITVSYFDENYLIDSFFHEVEILTQEPINKTNQIVKIKIKEDVEGSTSEQSETLTMWII